MCIWTKHDSNLASEFAHEGHYLTITFILDHYSTLRAMIGIIMKQAYLKSLTTDGLWSLHESIAAKLAEKLIAEKTMLEDRLRLLRNGYIEQAVRAPGRRPYPRVLPKFRNPEEPTETWAGRGKQPRWLRKQLRSGKRIDDFRIRPSAAA